MVLLRGLNYDYSVQQNSQLTAALVSGSGTAVAVDNTEGFAINDYILINPREETAEIAKVAAVPSDVSLSTTSTLKFAHSNNEWVYRLPYNQMVFYECDTVSGTYTAITSGSITEMSFTDVFTTNEYEDGDADYYFKRIFKNETTGSVSDIDLSESWQTNDELFYVTPAEMRTLLQLGPNDPPSPADMATILTLAQDNVDLDVNSSSSTILRIALFLKGKSDILRALGTKALSKGYITINIEGRQITKAWQELVLEAENTTQEYNKFILNNGNRTEVTKTDFLDDTTAISSTTRREVLDLWQGTQNIIDLESYARTTYGRKRRL